MACKNSSILFTGEQFFLFKFFSICALSPLLWWPVWSLLYSHALLLSFEKKIQISKWRAKIQVYYSLGNNFFSNSCRFAENVLKWMQKTNGTLKLSQSHLANIFLLNYVIRWSNWIWKSNLWLTLNYKIRKLHVHKRLELPDYLFFDRLNVLLGNLKVWVTSYQH